MLTYDEAAPAGDELEGVPIVGGLQHASALAACGIRVVFLEVEQRQTRPTLDRLQQDFRRVILLHDFDDLPIEGLRVRNLGNLVGIEYTKICCGRGTRRSSGCSTSLSEVSRCSFDAGDPDCCAAGPADRWGPRFFHQSRPGLAGRRIKVPNPHDAPPRG